jgi:DNA-binding transcriptional regulator YdaS (Cro superfamily)
MQLGEWIGTQPRGALRRLAERSGVAYRTLLDLKDGKRAARPDTARAIVKATGGAVTLKSLMSPPLPYFEERKIRRAARSRELQLRQELQEIEARRREKRRARARELEALQALRDEQRKASA